jgi:hypothetical protein
LSEYALGDEIPANPDTKRQLVSRLANELLHETGLACFGRYRSELRTGLRSLRGTKTASRLLPNLIQGLSTGDSDIQLRAIRAIEDLQECTSEVVAALVDSIHQGEEPVRRHSAFTLAILGDSSSEAFEALLMLLESDALEAARFAAAGALARALIPSPEVVQPLLEVARRGPKDLRITATLFLALVQHKSPEASAYIVNVLDSDSLELQVAATFAIQLVERVDKSISPEVKDALLRLLRHGTEQSRHLSASVLSDLGDVSEELTQILVDVIHSTDDRSQASAIITLLQHGQGSTEAIETLSDLAKNSTSSAGSAALMSLVHFAEQSTAASSKLEPVMHSTVSSIGLGYVYTETLSH